VARKRIALSMRPADPARPQGGQGQSRPRERQEGGRTGSHRAGAVPSPQNTAMAAAFAKLKR
jgi:uncharacterized protein